MILSMCCRPDLMSVLQADHRGILSQYPRVAQKYREMFEGGAENDRSTHFIDQDGIINIEDYEDVNRNTGREVCNSIFGFLLQLTTVT